MTTTNPKTLPLPPGNFGLPIIGETISFLKDSDFTDKRYEKYGSIFKTRLFANPTIVMIGSEANRFLFTNDNKYFANQWPTSTRILLGAASISVQMGSTHQKRRKIISQAFQPRALAGYTDTMEEILHSYLHKWEKMGTLTWYPEIRKYTFDVACKLLVGTDGASNGNFIELFEQWVGGIFSIPLRLPWTNFGKALRCRKLLLEQIEKIVLQRQLCHEEKLVRGYSLHQTSEDSPQWQDLRQQQPASSNDALGILLQAKDDDGNSLSLEEIKDQILNLLFAGHETLTSAIGSMCLLLAQHPEVLAAVRNEQQQLGFSQPLTSENLQQMTYLDQVIKEVLRLIPPVGGGFRQVIEPFEFNGYFIPQGWSILYRVPNTHQDTSVYMQASEFDPERFAPYRAEDKAKPFSNIPFGGGVRECIGKEFAKLEMKIFAALLVRGYNWELLPDQNLNMITIPTPHPKDGLKVKFSRLNS